MTYERVRLALIGFGPWGRNYIKAAKATGNARVNQVVLRDTSPSLPAAQWAMARVISFQDDLLNLKNADAVVVATHPSAAPDICIAALKRGLPVMVEKPAALSVADAERIANAAAAARLPFLVCHQHLFAIGYEQVRQRAIDGDLEARWHGPGPVRDYSALWDYGPHAIAAVLGARSRMPDCQSIDIGPVGQELHLSFGSHKDRAFVSNNMTSKSASIRVLKGSEVLASYDGYESAEPPLTRAIRSFANAVRENGSEDWRFGAAWAVRISKIIELLHTP